jgi:hypothetical protein
MKRTLVRYKTKPEMAEENQRLIEKVFQELHEKSPDGVRYVALRLGDGSFIHFSIAETGETGTPLLRLEAFQAFQSKVKERCVEGPQQSEATVIGNYRMLSE